MGLNWTPEQRKIAGMLAEDKPQKDIAAAGHSKALVSKVKTAIEEGDIPPPDKPLAVAPKPKLTGEEGEGILNVVTGFETEEINLLFIFNPVTRKVIEFRHKYPRAVPMYLDCLKDPVNFKGSFDEWLMSMAQSYLKAAGWVHAMVPRGQGQIYEEFERLLLEGKIKLDFDEYSNPKLEVIHGNGEGRDGGEGEGEGDKHTKTGARSPDDEVPTRSTTRKKRQPAKTK